MDLLLIVIKAREEWDLCYPPRLSLLNTLSSQFHLKIISKHLVFHSYFPPHNMYSAHLGERLWLFSLFLWSISVSRKSQLNWVLFIMYWSNQFCSSAAIVIKCWAHFATLALTDHDNQCCASINMWDHFKDVTICLLFIFSSTWSIPRGYWFELKLKKLNQSTQGHPKPI